jgi:hypothetical protein
MAGEPFRIVLDFRRIFLSIVIFSHDIDNEIMQSIHKRMKQASATMGSRRKFTVVMLTVYGGQAGKLGSPRGLVNYGS